MRVEHVLQALALGALLAVLGGYALARLLRRRHLRASWAALALPPTYLALGARSSALPFEFALLYAWALGARWHREDHDQGADFTEAARTRLRVRDLLLRVLWRRRVARGGFIHGGRLVVGVDARGLPVSIPIGGASGKHTLVLGATGAGKTVSAAWLAARLIESGHGAVVVDPKGDEMLRAELSAAAQRRGAEFLEWTPEGSLAYNPYASGSESEIADKALAGERFTEPHYLRQAQRYLGHAVRAMQAAGVAVTPLTLMAALDPRELEVLARELPAAQAKATERYLDSLSERQQRELAGIRDRLSILAESEARAWLDPGPGRPALELARAVRARAVVYFRLDSDRRPLLSAMLAAAIVSDLISLVAHLQAAPVPTVVLIDEFSALASEHVSRLFARARSAGISLILSTQELADLRAAGGAGASALRDQTLGNVSSVIAHRQNVPASAQLIAAMAGSTPRWRTTQHTQEGTFGSARTGRGSRSRDYELLVHPSQIKALRTGEALVLAPGDGQPTVTRIYAPEPAHPPRRPRLARASAVLQRLRVGKPNPRRKQ